MPNRLDLQMKPTPSGALAALPLCGITVLAVEDSRLACEALRLMCRKLGARLRRAESLRAAQVHLRLYRPDVVMVDLGLPDGRGEGLIAALCAQAERPLVLGLSGDAAGRGLVMAAGADGFLDKPLESLRALQNTLLALLEDSAGQHSPLPEALVAPDPLALRDDLAYAARLLDCDPDPQTQHYLARFLGGVARHARDPQLAEAALRAPPAALRAALHQRLSQPDQAFARPNL